MLREEMPAFTRAGIEAGRPPVRGGAGVRGCGRNGPGRRLLKW